MYLPVGDLYKIRAYSPTDATALHRILSDPKTMRYIEPPFTLEQTAAFLKENITANRVFALVDDRDEVIGHVIFHPYDEKCHEIGWIIDRAYQNQGIATQVTYALVDHAKNNGIDNLVMEYHPAQEVTKHISMKTGFARIGQCDGLYLYGRSAKDIPPFLQENVALYAGIIQLYKRGTVRILEEAAAGVFVQDTHGISYMLAASDLQLAKEWLRRHADRKYDLMMVIGDELAEYARTQFGFGEQMDVYQAVYEEGRPLTYDVRLDVIPASETDMDFVRANYSNLDEDELAGIIRDQNLFLGYSGDVCVGFIGQHLEGSMGLLEILPGYRRQGYGAELERFMINKMLTDGLFPYCQFQTDNTASRALQEKLGLRILPDTITWLF